MEKPIINNQDLEKDLMTEEFFNDPYSFYDKVRTQGKPYWSEKLNAWLVTDYNQVVEGMRNSAFQASRKETYFGLLSPEDRAEMEPLKAFFDTWLLFSDDPYHEKIKNLVIASFTPKFVKSLSGKVEGFAEKHTQEFKDKNEIDFVQEYAIPLSVSVIADVLGVSTKDYEQILKWTYDIVGFMGTGRPNIEKGREALKSYNELKVYLQNSFKLKRENPKDDLISNLLINQFANSVTDDEMYALIANILIDGHEPSSFSISNGMLSILKNPEQRDLLLTDIGGKVDGFMEETLRFDPPFTYSGRRTDVDVVFHDVEMKENQRVLFLVGAANRDPKVFENPNTFDISRKPNRHLTFGYGTHYCLGASLARLTLKTGFSKFFEKFPTTKLVTTSPKWRDSVGYRAFDNLIIDKSDEK
jgi:cytochrome P450